MDIKQGLQDKEDRIAKHKDIIYALMDDLKSLKPEIEIVYGKYTESMIYYTVSVIKSKIVVSKEARSLYIKDDASKLIQGKFFTEKEAKDAISEIMPLALDKFNKCLGAYRKLASDMQFSIGFNYDGDTHGIYNEYDYLSFKMNELSFQFLIE